MLDAKPKIDNNFVLKDQFMIFKQDHRQLIIQKQVLIIENSLLTIQKRLLTIKKHPKIVQKRKLLPQHQIFIKVYRFNEHQKKETTCIFVA